MSALFVTPAYVLTLVRYSEFQINFISSPNSDGSTKCHLLTFLIKVPSLVEALIEEEEEEDPCAGKQCTANEHCCDGHVCVDVDENDQNPGKIRIDLFFA